MPHLLTNFEIQKSFKEYLDLMEFIQETVYLK